MRTLLLLRHAKADPGPPDLSDHERPLNAKGRTAAEAMGRYLAARGHAPSLVLCSSSLRTVETLESVRDGLLGVARAMVEEPLYLASAGSLLARLSEVDDAEPSLLLIGHNPAIQQLACSLAVEGDARARERMARRFTPASCAVIAFEGAWTQLSRGGRLLDFTRPADLRD
jgi:phosphohistidine phosphatase